MGRNLSKQYDDFVKDGLATAVPYIGSIGRVDKESKDLSNFLLEGIGLVGELMKTIDELQKNQEKLLEQVECLSKYIKHNHEASEAHLDCIYAKLNDGKLDPK